MIIIFFQSLLYLTSNYYLYRYCFPFDDKNITLRGRYSFVINSKNMLSFPVTLKLNLF